MPYTGTDQELPPYAVDLTVHQALMEQQLVELRRDYYSLKLRTDSPSIGQSVILQAVLWAGMGYIIAMGIGSILDSLSHRNDDDEPDEKAKDEE